jgi:hypothetical protein
MADQDVRLRCFLESLVASEPKVQEEAYANRKQMAQASIGNSAGRLRESDLTKLFVLYDELIFDGLLRGSVDFNIHFELSPRLGVAGRTTVIHKARESRREI